MGTIPKIGSSKAMEEHFKDINFDETPVPEPPPPTAEGAAMAEIYGMDLDHLFQPLTRPPDPPPFITRDRPDRVWRWLSKPQVKYMGMRNYKAYSPTSEERAKIDAGIETPSGVFMDAENKVCWRDDSFLGWIERRLWEARQLQRRARTETQTNLAKQSGGQMSELAKRIPGGKSMIKVDQWEQKGE